MGHLQSRRRSFPMTTASNVSALRSTTQLLAFEFKRLSQNNVHVVHRILKFWFVYKQTQVRRSQWMTRLAGRLWARATWAVRSRAAAAAARRSAWASRAHAHSTVRARVLLLVGMATAGVSRLAPHSRLAAWLEATRTTQRASRVRSRSVAAVAIALSAPTPPRHRWPPLTLRLRSAFTEFPPATRTFWKSPLNWSHWLVFCCLLIASTCVPIELISIVFLLLPLVKSCSYVYHLLPLNWELVNVWIDLRVPNSHTPFVSTISTVRSIWVTNDEHSTNQKGPGFKLRLHQS